MTFLIIFLKKSLTKIITIINSDFKYLGIKKPRILVCGLNPHAGEKGYLGDEEITTIIPAINKLKKAGFNLTGPVPADTAFTPDSLKNIDVVLAMYHDQGLPVLKAQGFKKAANITLGLPFFRTSVDHGTALRSSRLLAILVWVALIRHYLTSKHLKDNVSPS